MSFSPDWRLDAMWIHAACNEVLSGQDKQNLECTIRKVYRNTEARRVFHEVCGELSDANNLTELALIQALSKDPRWIVSVQSTIWPTRRGGLMGLWA